MTARSAAPRPGFDEYPQRHGLVTIGLFVVVVAASVGVAVGFKRSAHWLIDIWGGSGDPSAVASRFRWLVTGLVVAAVTITAATIGRMAERRWTGHFGIEAVAASARGEHRRIMMRATLVRAAATYLSVVGLVPIGRESAIIETGGAIGSTLGRRFRGRGATMATAGIAAAFATAYHAPIAAVLYLEEHLRIRASRRALRFSVGGSVGGFVLATRVLGSAAILPRTAASVRELSIAGLVAVVPASVAARLFLVLRSRATARPPTKPRLPRWLLVGATGVVTGLSVAAYPLAAGNGLEALRRSSTQTTAVVAIAAAMLIGKLVGTTSAFASGVPGGALTPTMTVAGGASLLVVAALDRVGVHAVGVWPVVVMSAAIGIAIGLRSPLMAVVLVPEMMGQLALVPATAAVVAVAVLAERSFDQVVLRLQRPSPPIIHDQDG